MARASSRNTPARRRPVASAAATAACLLGLTLASIGYAQTPAARAVATAAKPIAEQGPRWSDLKPAQQVSLKPLEPEWSGIDPRSKRKWLELSSRFAKLAPDEQMRVQARMSEWAKLTPRERGEARIRFQEAKQLSAHDRQARWKEYEALSPQQKQQLATRASPSASAAEPVRKTATSSAAIGSRADKTAHDGAAQAKSNIVPNPSFASPPKAVAPTIVQAGPGATTTSITKRATPPGHQQTGMPKIAATPEFVNKSTLLPQRGPQGAAVRGASAPGVTPAQ